MQKLYKLWGKTSEFVRSFIYISLNFSKLRLYTSITYINILFISLFTVMNYFFFSKHCDELIKKKNVSVNYWANLVVEGVGVLLTIMIIELNFLTSTLKKLLTSPNNFKRFTGKKN